MTEDAELVVEHRRIWGLKPHLRQSYGRYHDLLLAACPRDALVLELGCGLGHLGEKARERGFRRWISTDLTPSPSARLRCDALALPFSTGTLDRIVFIDLIHHLAQPRRFFSEAARVLRPGARIVCVEPWITPLSYPIYRWFHQEGCDLSRDVNAPFGRGTKAAYDGDAGLTTLVCRKVAHPEWGKLGLSPPRIRPFNDFAYLTTRGFGAGPDAPGAVFAATRAVLDGLLSPLSPILGLRALIEWTRRAAPPR